LISINTGTLIAIECLFIVAAFFLEPELTVVTYPVRNKAQLECYNSILTILGPLGYNIFLVICCTLFAIKTRNFPANFNEAKFIGFSMYTTCVIWLAFIPLYFGSSFKVITLCLSTSFSAIVLLTFLFVPKVYIIIFEPEKNQRSMFVTSKELRCHFGSNPQNKYVKSNGKNTKLAEVLRPARKIINNQSCQTSLQEMQLDQKGHPGSESEASDKNKADFLTNSELSLNKESILGSCESLKCVEVETRTICQKERENEIMENFRILFQHDKLTLNWDLVQSSDYL
jgi:hypothetical protein